MIKKAFEKWRKRAWVYMPTEWEQLDAQLEREFRAGYEKCRHAAPIQHSHPIAQEGTMDNPHKDLACHALGQLRGDDLARAQRAFANYTPEQMSQEYGQSGKTCAEILAGYETFNDAVNAAIDWVKAPA